jgi:hypothetical protein
MRILRYDVDVSNIAHDHSAAIQAYAYAYPDHVISFMASTLSPSTQYAHTYLK